MSESGGQAARGWIVNFGKIAGKRKKFPPFYFLRLLTRFEKLLLVDTGAWVEGEVFGNHMGGAQVAVRRLGFPHHSLIIIGNKIGLSAYVV